MSKIMAATAAVAAAVLAAPLIAASGGYQFILSGDPVAARTVGSSSASSGTTALVSGPLAGEFVLESEFEAGYRTWYESPARSLRSDEFRGFIITFR